MEFHWLCNYRVRSCTSLNNERFRTSWYRGLSFCDLRQSGFVPPSASQSVPIYALGPLTEQLSVKDSAVLQRINALHNYTAWVHL